MSEEVDLEIVEKLDLKCEISEASSECKTDSDNQPKCNDEVTEQTNNDATENSSDNKTDNEVTENDSGQVSEDIVKEISLPDTDEVTKESDEDKTLNLNWCSQWSEQFDSLEDDRPIEDFKGDPKKLVLWAAEKNELETLRKLLEKDPTLVHARDNDLYTPLHRASYNNNTEVIKILLSYDADISAKTADEWEPLHCACKWDSVEAVSLLLQNGANVNAQTKGNITPLHLAASNVNGRRTLELLLVQPYIDPNLKNDSGDTAYDIAYRSGPYGALFEIVEESLNVY